MKIPAIPPVPTFDTLFAFIEFLKDKDSVAATAQRLEEMRLAVNERLGDLDTKDKADALLAQAQIDRAAAAREIAAAREEVARTTAAAALDVTAAKDSADAQARQRAEALDARTAEIAAQADAVAARQAAVEQREAAATERYDAGNRALTEGKALKGEFEVKLRKLREAGVA